MKLCTSFFLSIPALLICLPIFNLGPLQNPIDESSVTLDGVVYAFDKDPFSEAILSDETKYEKSYVESKLEYKLVKTGERTIMFIFNDNKNKQTINITTYFDGKTGQKVAKSADGMDSKWAGISLYGKHEGSVNITSLKKIEPYKYIVSGTFEKNVVTKTRNYQFKGVFKDFVVTDIDNPELQKMLNREAPAAFKKAGEEMKKDAQKNRN